MATPGSKPIFTFTDADDVDKWLRMAIDGPAGSGKTFTALALACYIAEKLGGVPAVLDSERGTAAKYANFFKFKHCSISDEQSAKVYRAGIEAAQAGGFKVLVIDSLSHAWAGKDGALEMADRITEASASQNYWASWRKVSPEHNRLVEAILQSPMHVICTMRVKTEWVLEKDEKTGKSAPKKIGMKPVMRDGIDYEFDVVGDINTSHVMAITKTRCNDLDGKTFDKPGDDLAEILFRWVGDAKAAPKPAPATAPAESPAPAPAKPAAEKPKPRAKPKPKAEPAPEPASDPAPAKGAAITNGHLNKCLIEFMKITGEKTTAAVKELFIEPLEVESLKELPQKRYPELIGKILGEYAKRKIDLPEEIQTVRRLMETE